MYQAASGFKHRVLLLLLEHECMNEELSMQQLQEFISVSALCVGIYPEECHSGALWPVSAVVLKQQHFTIMEQ